MLLRQTAAFSVLSNKEKGTAMAVVPLKQRGQLCGHTRKYITKNPKDREKKWALFKQQSRFCISLGHLHFSLTAAMFPRTVWISFFHIFHSIMRFFNNGFLCLCRLSSSSSTHYKQTLNGWWNPRWENVPLFVRQSIFFFFFLSNKGVRSRTLSLTAKSVEAGIKHF